METIEVTERTLTGKKVRRLRRDGFIPGVVYGQSQSSRAVSVPGKDFGALWERTGESTLVTLAIYESEGGELLETDRVLIYDVALDPLSDKPIHIDFHRVNMLERIRVNVPLVFVGESPAVAEAEGVLVKSIHEVEVEALPGELPKEIVADISTLKTFADHIALKDLELPPGVRSIGEPEMIVASVKPPRSAEELEALAEKPAESVADIELSEKRGKAEEEQPEDAAS